MTQETARKISIGVFIGLAVLLVAWELVCLVLPGVPTLSHMLLDAHIGNRLVGFGVVFGLGVLVGHLFLPQMR